MLFEVVGVGGARLVLRLHSSVSRVVACGFAYAVIPVYLAAGLGWRCIACLHAHTGT
jgi:hypothetical protein